VIKSREHMQKFCTLSLIHLTTLFSDKSQTPPTRAAQHRLVCNNPAIHPYCLQREGAVKRPCGGGERQPTGQAKPP
jgi:hypothetical protein